MIISISGVDGVGKSQQINLLRLYNGGNLTFAKPLIEYSPRWPKLKGHDMFNWWFKEIGIKEFIDIIIESLNLRYSETKNSVNIFDRGTLMFKAVCAATVSVRTGRDLNDIIRSIGILFSQKLNYKPKEEHNILLLPNLQYQESVSPYLNLLRDSSEVFAKEDDDFYNAYQDLLKKAVAICFDDNAVDRVSVDSSICETQNKLRHLIEIITGQSLSEICPGLKQIIGFGGLSECGKSSFADSLRRNRGYYRLKLGYFVEILKRHGRKDTPENVAMEFLHFCKTHYYVDKFTLESLHEPHTPAYLKLLFGAKFQIVYLNVPFDTRSKRASIEQKISLLEAEKETRLKDLVKKERGAEIVGQIADISFDNSEWEHLENMLRLEKLIGL